MRKLIIVLIFFVPIVCLAQQDTLVTIDDVEELIPVPLPEESRGDIFEVVEQMPEYKGGRDSLSLFIAKNIVYPKKALKMGKQGIVYVKFIVEPDGSITDVRVIKTFDDGCAKEAERVLKYTSGKWIPGKQRGKNVRVNVVQPVKFKLN